MSNPKPRRDDNNVPWCNLLCEFKDKEFSYCNFDPDHRRTAISPCTCLPALIADMARLKELEAALTLARQMQCKRD
jgi:hypothetical protein